MHTQSKSETQLHETLQRILPNTHYIANNTCKQPSYEGVEQIYTLPRTTPIERKEKFMATFSTFVTPMRQRVSPAKSTKESARTHFLLSFFVTVFVSAYFCHL